MEEEGAAAGTWAGLPWAAADENGGRRARVRPRAGTAGAPGVLAAPGDTLASGEGESKPKPMPMLMPIPEGVWGAVAAPDWEPDSGGADGPDTPWLCVAERGASICMLRCMAWAAAAAVQAGFE